MLSFIVRGENTTTSRKACTHRSCTHMTCTHKAYNVDMRDLAATTLDELMVGEDEDQNDGISLDQILNAKQLTVRNEPIEVLEYLLHDHATSYRLRRVGRERCCVAAEWLHSRCVSVWSAEWLGVQAKALDYEIAFQLWKAAEPYEVHRGSRSL